MPQGPLFSCLLACFLPGEERLCAGVKAGGFNVPVLAALRWFNHLRRVRALLPRLGPLPVSDLRRVQLCGSEMIGLCPRERPPMLTPHSSARRNIHRQVSGIEQVPPQSFPQIQPVVLPEVGTQRPAILPQEKREA